MGNISSNLNSAFRDHVVDGVSSSGAHEVIKSEVRAIGPLIEAAIGNAALGALITVAKDTKANLDADLAHAANVVAIVYADGTDANNDLYIKIGASGSGSWSNTNIIHDALAAAGAPIIEQAEAARDAVASALLDIQAVQFDAGNRIGPETPGTGAAASSATYVIASPVEKNGTLVGIKAFSAGAGNVQIKRFTKSGDVFTQVDAGQSVTLASGLNEITLTTPMAVHAGEYLGFSQAGSLVHYKSGPDALAAWYSGAAGATSFTDASATTSSPIQFRFMHKFPAVTLTRLEAVEEAAGELEAGKLAFVPPLAPSTYLNAIRNRYGQRADVHPLSYYQATPEAAYNDDLYQTYGEPNAVRCTASPSIINDYKPEVEIDITPSDLARIGIIPDDGTPPVVSVRAAILLAGLVNQTITTTAGDSYGQVWVGLRYDGASGLTTAGFSAARQDVVFINAITGVSASYYVPSPNPFSAVTGRMLSDTSRFKGYAREGIPIPATVNGKALTLIRIKVYGRNPATGTARLDLARLALVAGATIDDAQSYVDKVEQIALAATDAGSTPHYVTIQNSDRVAVLGNSFSESFYTPLGKHWIGKASAFSDYNFENFAVSGETYASNLERLRAGTLTYGNRSFKDYGVTYALMMNATNDPAYSRYSDYLDDVRGSCETVRAAGAIPIVATEFVPGKFGGEFQIGLKAVAEECGAHFVDILPTARNFDTTREAEFWGSGHPGVRTNELISEPIERFLKSLPRPDRSLKIFRKRSTVTVGTLDDLIFESHFDRARLFKEIATGQKALASGSVKYMDKLAAGAGSYTADLINSEYLKLQAGVAVSFADYALVDAILPGTIQTISSVALLINEPGASVYVRNVLAAPYESATRYQRFEVSGSPTIVVGDTYTSNDPDLSGTFTVVGISGSQLIMSPMDADRTLEGAGTLTRTSGTGSSSITYTSSMPGYHPDYYTNQGKPEGHWQAVSGDGTGRFELSSLSGALLYDRVQFLIYKSGGFSLSLAEIEWTGEGGKHKPVPINLQRAAGAELLAQPLCGTAPQLAGWTVEGSLTPGKVAGDNSGTPYGTTGYVTVTAANRMSQAFAFTASMDEAREAEIRIKCRRFPALVDAATYPTGAAITDESFDWDRLQVDLIDGATVIAPHRDKVGLWWKEAVFRILIPASKSSLTLRIGSAGGAIQVAAASVKFMR